MMPTPGQSAEAFLAQVAQATGANAERATEREIQTLQELGYEVHNCDFEDCPDAHQWVRVLGTVLHECAPDVSMSQDDAWAAAKQDAREKGLI